MAVELDLTADEASIGGELAAPQSVTQHDLSIGSLFVFALEPRSAQQRSRTQSGKEVCLRRHAADIARVAAAGQVDALPPTV